MIKLINILSEIEDDKSNNISTEIGQELDDIFKDELNKASKQQNEEVILLTTIALIAAIPGFLKAISKIAENISRKQGIDLKKDNKSWYKVLYKFADKIDDYIDAPFNFILKPLVKDDIKRKKILSIIKGACIITMAILGSVDLSKTPEITNILKSSAGEFTQELIQKSGEKNIDKIVEFTKNVIKNILN
jgi:hypothetical protein